MKWLLAITITLALALLILIALVWMDRYISGPDLAPTADSISLSQTFPPGVAPAGLLGASRYADDIGASSIIVVRDGNLLFERGETDRKISAHSVRKSMVSALYGIAVERALIDVNKTLDELGLDDVNPPLNDIEKSARLVDLLTARSGIYHPSVTDDGGAYPPRGTHAPGEAFFYNNWSFNALGGMFEELTGLTLGQAFHDWIALPTGMQDFASTDVRYTQGSESRYRAYRFWVSARDLARFGQLYLDGGSWRGTQVIPEQWVALSLTRHTDNPDGASYGYMWWIMPDGSFLATGTGGQKIRLFPHTRTMIVTRVDTGEGFSRAVWWNFGKRVGNNQTLELLRILDEG